MASANGHPSPLPSIAVPIRLRAGGERVHAWYSNLNVTACGCSLSPGHLAIAKGPVNCARCKLHLKTPPQVVQVLCDGIVTTGLLLARSVRSFMVVIRRPTVVWVPHKAVVMLQEQAPKEGPRDRVVTPARLPYRGPENWREKTVLQANGEAASPAAALSQSKGNGSKAPKTRRPAGHYSLRKRQQAVAL
jgi:hypothetical protein